MGSTIEIMFALICSEITQSEISEDIRKKINNDMLFSIYQISQNHDITNLIAASLKRNNLLDEDSEIGKKYAQQMFMAVYRYERMNYELKKICCILDENQIAFMPLKGSVIRKYYSEPWLRTSCDIDIYVKESDLKNITSLLVSDFNYKLGRKDVYDVSLDSDAGVHVELHFALTENDKKVNKVFETIWDTATKADETEYHYIMSNDMFVLYHIAHMAKHFVSGGCGIRPFIDLWIAKNKMGYDLVNVKKLLQECGLGVFGEAVLLLSDVWFSNAQHTEATKEMELYIVGAGSYGTMENKVAISQAKKGGRIKYALGRIFQSYSMLKIYYPRLEKYPILFPYYQVKRWCRILFTKNKKRAFAELKYNVSVSEEKKKRLADLCNDLELL